jgi:hypothetical protein
VRRFPGGVARAQADRDRAAMRERAAHARRDSKLVHDAFARRHVRETALERRGHQGDAGHERWKQARRAHPLIKVQ